VTFRGVAILCVCVCVCVDVIVSWLLPEKRQVTKETLISRNTVKYTHEIFDVQVHVQKLLDAMT